MKKLLLVLAGILVVLAGCHSPLENIKSAAVQNSAITGEYMEGQMIVCIEPEARGIQEVEQLMTTASKGLENSSGSFKIENSITDGAYSKSAIGLSEDFKSRLVKKMGHVYTFSYDASKFSSFGEAAQTLSALLAERGFSVRYVEPNYVMHALEAPSGDSIGVMAVHANQEWNYNMVKAPQAWTLVTGSAETRIAVLDTGIDNTHIALANFVNMDLAKTFVGGTTMDKKQHGTHVSGTIASYGPVSGVMQVAMLIPVKVLKDDGTGTLDGITQGIIYAANITRMSSICRLAAAALTSP